MKYLSDVNKELEMRTPDRATLVYAQSYTIRQRWPFSGMATFSKQHLLLKEKSGHLSSMKSCQLS